MSESMIIMLINGWMELSIVNAYMQSSERFQTSPFKKVRTYLYGLFKQ